MSGSHAPSALCIIVPRTLGPAASAKFPTHTGAYACLQTSTGFSVSSLLLSLPLPVLPAVHDVQDVRQHIFQTRSAHLDTHRGVDASRSRSCGARGFCRGNFVLRLELVVRGEDSVGFSLPS